ncbi:MAG: hypothetical protein ACQEXX_30290 [Bacillota bacterium]
MNTPISLDARQGIGHKKDFIVFCFSIFLFYISVYGTLSIYMDNMSLRSIKDLILLLLVVYGVVSCFKRELLNPILLYVYLSLYLITFASVLVSRDVISLLYGIKITLLPMGMLFLGALIAKRLEVKKILLSIYFMLLIAWVLQYYLGVDRLIELGFVYGVNIKHFAGLLRLPSTVGSPDSYAIYIALIGALLNSKFKGKVRILFIIITTVFVVLSTIRTAILFWIVYNVFIIIQGLVKSKRKNQSLLLSMLCFTISIVILIVPKFSTTSYASTSSVADRLSHWFDNLQPLNGIEGFVGRGMGMVGSASRRISDLNLNSLDYAVDSQYLAIYEQIGLLGIAFFVLFLMVCVYLLFRKRAYEGLAILLATLLSCFVTNTMELYPFNVLMWLVIGMSIVNYKVLK